MAQWMIFASLDSANSAIEIIDGNIGFLPGEITNTWATPFVTADNKYAIIAPEDEFLSGVTGYTIGVPVWLGWV